MADQQCLNCDAAMPRGVSFCPTCGQRADTARLTFTDMARDLLHSFVNIERGPVHFAVSLLTRPGYMARDYVRGRRRRYYGPFASLAVLAGLTALALQVSGFHALSQEVSSHSAALLNQYFNLVLLAQLPVLGAFCALIFRDARLTLPEHMVLVAYTLCVRALALIILMPLAVYHAASAPTALSTAVFWGAWYIVFAWAAGQFYEAARWRSWIRGLLVAALGHGTIVGALMVTSMVYEAIGRT